MGEKIDTVWKAAAYGDFERLKELAAESPGALQRQDEQGFWCLQWAALNNRVALITYLLDQGADLGATDGSGQTAAHWAAVRGSLQALETLLRAGAEPTTQDSRGYTVCHVAAQYGQTALLHHLALRWNVDLDSPDHDGRTPLHWAAYKGFADTVRLLLLAGARPALPDREGCTPVHWAAIRGNAEAATALLQGGGEEALQLPDGTGSTPAALALEKGHRLLGMHLSDYRSCQQRGRHTTGMAATLGRLHLSPVIWGLILALLAMLTYNVVQNPRFPPPGRAMVAAAWLAYALAGAGLYFLYRTTAADPGFLPLGAAATLEARAGEADVGGTSPLLGGAKRGSPAVGARAGSSSGGGGSSGGALGVLDSPALAAGQWAQICVSCRNVRPLRAKHCSVTNRCVEVFDHYCPWVGNAVGKGNRHLFLTFLWLELGAIVVSLIAAVVRVHAALSMAALESGGGLYLLWPVMFMCFDVFMLISVAALAIAQASQVARNTTTNELANWHRYKYLHGLDGEFDNPFDRGWRHNCAETCSPHSVPRAPYVPNPPSGDAALRSMEAGGGCSSAGCSHHHHHRRSHSSHAIAG